MAFNEKNRDRVMPYFAQEHMARDAAKGGLDSKKYLDALANNLNLSRGDGIDKALLDSKLDALVAPTGSPAWLTDLIRGDHSGRGFSSAAAFVGYPHITVPGGFVSGLPVGISFVGTAWSEPKLIAMAYAFEQATKHRRASGYLIAAGVYGATLSNFCNCAFSSSSIEKPPMLPSASASKRNRGRSHPGADSKLKLS